MNSDPRSRDPLDPRDPAAERVGYTDPRYSNQTVVTGSGGGRAGLAVAAIVVALLVIGFIAFSGNNQGVDTTPTASTNNSSVMVPGNDASGSQAPAQSDTQQAAPAAPQDNAPAAAPQQDNAPTANN